LLSQTKQDKPQKPAFFSASGKITDEVVHYSPSQVKWHTHIHHPPNSRHTPLFKQNPLYKETNLFLVSSVIVTFSYLL